MDERDDKIAQLTAKLQAAHDRITYIEDAIVGRADEFLIGPFLHIHLTRRERQIVGLLIRKEGKASRNALYQFLYSDKAGDGPNEKIIDAMVCKLRRKFRDSFGDAIAIETLWGWGYQFSRGSLAAIKSLVERQTHAAAAEDRSPPARDSVADPIG